MSRIAARLLPLPLLVLAFIYSGSAGAQSDRKPNLNLGDAVVTGFSGTVSPDPSLPRPPNKSAIDLTFIDPDGASAHVIALGRPGFPWDGRLFDAPKTFDVFARDTGQVFGVALDDQNPPNIYLAATSAYGLQLVSRGGDGPPERRKTGGPGVGWMKGQFGLDLQGDPGSIYRVDGRTGVVNLFAKVMLDGVPNPGPALGNLAYDAAHKQLFVSDLYTGMIHRFAVADGSELGPPYDHGVTGRAAAHLAPVPFDPSYRPNIGNSHFNTENPDSWGYAPPARRVWALAVHGTHLYYSVRNGAGAEGPQIWSVRIAPDGSLGTEARWELDVPAKPGPYAVSDIRFSGRGAMIVAQRAPGAGSYDYTAFTQPGEPRVLRFWRERRDDPNATGRWKPMPEEYAIGFAGNYRNTDGGADLEYGYDRNGVIDTNACEAAIVVTGEKLRLNPALQDRLAPGGPLPVDGLQISPADAVREANTPPWTSYFVDYDNKFDRTNAGWLGDVRVYRAPCGGSGAVIVPVPPVGGGGVIVREPGPPPACRPPMVRGELRGECVCPRDTAPTLDGRCVRRDHCDPPMVQGPVRGECVCPRGTELRDGRCERDRCDPPMVRGPNGKCECPRDTELRDGRCVRRDHCDPPLVPGPNGKCECPRDTQLRDGRCERRDHCDPPLVPGPNGKCECPRDTELRDGRCVKHDRCDPPLVPGPNGKCECPRDTELRDGRCVKHDHCDPPLVPGPNGKCECPRGTELRDGRCGKPPAHCDAPFVPSGNGQCVCPGGTTLNNGRCVKPPAHCDSPFVPNGNGQCVCPAGTTPNNGRCVKPNSNGGGGPGQGQGQGGGRNPRGN